MARLPVSSAASDNKKENPKIPRNFYKKRQDTGPGDTNLHFIFRFINENGIKPGPDKVPIELFWRLFKEKSPAYKWRGITKQYFAKQIGRVFTLKRREHFRCYLLDNSNHLFDLSPNNLKTIHKKRNVSNGKKENQSQK